MRWCVRPAPLPQELLSSWLHRLALANALTDHTLCRHMFGNLAIWNRDVDRCFPKDRMAVIATWTGINEVRLAPLRLDYWTGRLSEQVNIYGNSPWILPMGVYHRVRRRNGVLFCPACLKDGPADVLWMWRMAWSTCCRRHRVRLLENCPQCASPYMPHRSEPNLFGRACCVGCGFDLSKAATERAEVWEWQFQQRLETAMHRGSCQIGRQGHLALGLMEGLRILVRVILRPKWQDGAHLVLGHRIGMLRSGRRAIMFEHQPMSIRRQVMRVLWEILQDWPTGFRHIMRRADIPRYAFDVEGKQVPFWLQTALDDVPGVQPRIVDKEEWRSACRWLRAQEKPVTRASLLATMDIGSSPFGQPYLSDALEEFHRA